MQAEEPLQPDLTGKNEESPEVLNKLLETPVGQQDQEEVLNLYNTDLVTLLLDEDDISVVSQVHKNQGTPG